MATKETTISYRVYYKSMIDTYTQEKEKLEDLLTTIEDNIKDLYNTINENVDIYKDKYNINLKKFDDFVNNEYNDGIFYKYAKGRFINRKENYVAISELFDLYRLASLQKDIKKTKEKIKKCNSIISISLKDYRLILKSFYTEVHKKMVLEGAGYVLGHNLGWICINRCHLEHVRPHIDYAATNKRKAELLAQGKKIYNKEEADWCKKNGFEYKAEDVRVFQKLEYVYEIPLLHCNLPEKNYKFTPADYRGTAVRGKTNDMLIDECGKDLNKICELDVDIKTKLALANKVNKMLYTKFIRNENQKPVGNWSFNRKNR